jgi:hypothetical protein
MFGAFSFAINVYSASEFFNDYKVLSSTSLGKDGYELKDSFSLKVKLNKDIASACNASSYKNTDETRAYLQQYRDDFIKCGLEQFKKQKAQYQNHNNIDDDYYYDDFYFEFDYSVNYKGIEYKISDAGTYVGDTVKLLSTDEQVEMHLAKCLMLVWQMNTTIVVMMNMITMSF